jgi:1-acyl-sn-glycerol-3-phosphate acyltransferase
VRIVKAWLRCLLRLSGFFLVCFGAAPFCAALSLLGRLAAALCCDWLEIPLIRAQARALQICSRAILCLCGIQVCRVKTVEQGPAFWEATGLEMRRSDCKEPRLILANHVSYLDVVVLGALYPSAFVAKKEISSWPVIGALCRGLGCIFIDRESLSDRVRALFTLERRLGLGSVCVFPEGTTTQSSVPLRKNWHRGQLWSAVANRFHKSKVTAVGIHYQAHEELAWVDDMAFFPHLLRVFARKEIKAFVSSSEIRVEVISGYSVTKLTEHVFKEVTQLCLCSARSARLELQVEIANESKETCVLNGGEFPCMDQQRL